MRTGAGDRDVLGLPGAETPQLVELDEVKAPLTDEEKFSAYQFDSQITFKNALAQQGLKMSQENNLVVDGRKKPKQRFTPGVFHNLFKNSK